MPGSEPNSTLSSTRQRLRLRGSFCFRPLATGVFSASREATGTGLRSAKDRHCTSGCSHAILGLRAPVRSIDFCLAAAHEASFPVCVFEGISQASALFDNAL